jgi:hypothetical protein
MSGYVEGPSLGECLSAAGLKRFSKIKIILFFLGKWERNKRIDFVFQFQLGCQYRLDSVVVGMMYASMSFQ